MLLLNAHNPNAKTFFALFYDPGGPNRSDYNWTMPFKIFNMHQDESVLIGEDYWNFLGGERAYVELLTIFDAVGNRTREAILKL